MLMLLRKFSAFTAISGVGWLIDVALMMGLVIAGMGPFAANCIGAFTAVSFVFVASRLRVFEPAAAPRRGGYWIYLAWHAVAIPAASGLIALLAAALGPAAAMAVEALARAAPALGTDPAPVAAGAAKMLVTPLTLAANFLYMRWLLERRFR